MRFAFAAAVVLIGAIAPFDSPAAVANDEPVAPIVASRQRYLAADALVAESRNAIDTRCS